MSKKRSRPRSALKYKKKRVSKSKSKPVLYTKKISSWFTDAKASRDQRLQQRTLQSGLKIVRKLYSGFTAEQGFDARHLKHWPDARVEALRDFISQANRLTSGEFHELYQVTYPRTPAQVAAIRLHTSQASPDELRHPQKGFVTYANTRNARVHFVTETRLVAAPMGVPIVETTTRAEIRQPVKDGVLVYRDYLFQEVLGFQPGVKSATPEGLRIGRLLRTFDPWEQMVIAMRRLVRVIPDRTARGDEAHYRLLSDRGPIGSGVPKHMLIETMRDWGETYDPSFVGTLIGVRYIGSEFAMRRQGVERDKRRMRYQRLAQELRAARARIRPDGSLSPHPKKKRITKKKRILKKKRSRSPKKKRSRVRK